MYTEINILKRHFCRQHLLESTVSFIPANLLPSDCFWLDLEVPSFVFHVEDEKYISHSEFLLKFYQLISNKFKWIEVMIPLIWFMSIQKNSKNLYPILWINIFHLLIFTIVNQDCLWMILYSSFLMLLFYIAW